jgi:hypothetical protein
MRAKILLSVPSMLDRKILIQNKFDAIFLSIAIDCDQPPCQVYGESWIADGRDRWRSLCFRTSVMYGNGNDEAGAVNNRKIPAASHENPNVDNWNRRYALGSFTKLDRQENFFRGKSFFCLS